MKRRHMPSRWLIISFVVALMHLALLPQAARADEIDDMLASVDIGLTSAQIATLTGLLD